MEAKLQCKQLATEKLPVFLRIRPCAPDKENVLKIINSKTVAIAPGASNGVDQKVRSGTFTAVIPDQTSQEEVFQKCTLPLLENLLQKNQDALLLAYGASGSGKTHTVSGYEEDSEGILGRTIKFFFQNLDSEPDLATVCPENFDDLIDSTVVDCKSSKGIWISVVQIHNEVVTDLLGDVQFKPLCIAQDSKGRCFVRNARWLHSGSESDAIGILQSARKRQSVASTKLNAASSRSHFAVFVKLVRKLSSSQMKVNQTVIVDLAGTERQTAAGSSGKVLRQAGFINASLLVLKRCVEALRLGNGPVPYRDSKLTRLLSPFFSTSTARVALIVCVSSEKERLGDTIASIMFSALASEMKRPQETLKCVQEARRKSAGFDVLQKSSEEVVEVPLHIIRNLRETALLAEKLIGDNDALDRQLRLLTEAAENSKLMYQDKLADQKKNYRTAMNTLRQEEQEMREMMKEDFQDELKMLVEKNAKYKKQAQTMASVLRDRLYPELEQYRKSYGLLDDYPPLSAEDLKWVEISDDYCFQCRQLSDELTKVSHREQLKNQLCERMSEELRSERELRVLLQERSRLTAVANFTRFPDSAMELTCDGNNYRSCVEGVSLSDSGNGTTQGISEETSIELNQLEDELARVREDLLNQMTLNNQKELVIEEITGYNRDLEDRSAQLEMDLKSAQILINNFKNTPNKKLNSCELDCDRCRRLIRLQEVPKTAPTTREHKLSPSAIRESKLTFTPVFRVLPLSARKPRFRKELPRRRLAQSDSSDHD